MKNKILLMSMFFCATCFSFATEWVEASGTVNSSTPFKSSAYVTKPGGYNGPVAYAPVSQSWWVTEYRNPSNLSGNPSWIAILATIGSGTRSSISYYDNWNIDANLYISWELKATWKHKIGSQSWTAWDGSQYLGQVSRNGQDYEFTGWVVDKNEKTTPRPSDPPLPG